MLAEHTLRTWQTREPAIGKGTLSYRRAWKMEASHTIPGQLLTFRAQPALRRRPVLALESCVRAPSSERKAVPNDYPWAPPTIFGRIRLQSTNTDCQIPLGRPQSLCVNHRTSHSSPVFQSRSHPWARREALRLMELLPDGSQHRTHLSVV